MVNLVFLLNLAESLEDEKPFSFIVYLKKCAITEKFTQESHLQSVFPVCGRYRNGGLER